MSKLLIRDLEQNADLDRTAMTRITGGKGVGSRQRTTGNRLMERASRDHTAITSLTARLTGRR